MSRSAAEAEAPGTPKRQNSSNGRSGKNSKYKGKGKAKAKAAPAELAAAKSRAHKHTSNHADHDSDSEDSGGEARFARARAMSTASDDDDDAEQEVPFTPKHGGKIALDTSTPGQTAQLSDAALAKLEVCTIIRLPSNLYSRCAHHRSPVTTAVPTQHITLKGAHDRSAICMSFGSARYQATSPLRSGV